MPSDSSQPSYWKIVSIIVICLITVVYAVYFIQSAVVLDSARDIHQAAGIADLNQFPMTGPDIGGVFHLGPVWYYFLAIPLLFDSLVLMALYVGLFAGLKFYLAYRLGSEFLDQKFGLIWACTLLMPGWHTINQFFITHTNLIESLSLLFLLMLYLYHQTDNKKYWYLSGLVFGLGFHAHPSFLALLVFYVSIIWLKRRQINFMMLLIAAALFLAPLLPYMIDQVIQGFPDWARWSARETDIDQVRATGKAVALIPWWQHWYENIISMLVEGPRRILAFISINKPGLGFYSTVLYWMALSIILLGVPKLLISSKLRERLFTGLILFALSMLLIINMRSFTPFYMVLALSPFLLGLLSLSAYAILNQRYGLMLGYVFVLFCLGLIPYFALHKAAKSGQVNLGPVMNITKPVSDNWQEDHFTLDMVSIIDAEDLAQVFCNKETVLNGPLAAVLDFTSGATIDYYCEQYSLSLGGENNQFDQSVLMMHKSFWDRIDRIPTDWVTPSWGAISEYKNHSIGGNLQFQPFNDYVHPPRSEYPKKTFANQTIKFESAGASYLLLTNILPANVQFKINKISANKQSVKTMMVNAANSLYYCEFWRNESVEWMIDLETNDINAIDFNTFAQ